MPKNASRTVPSRKTYNRSNVNVRFPWNNISSPFHKRQKHKYVILRAKKHSIEWILFGDYRTLNAQTNKKKYPLPCIVDLIAKLHGKQMFSHIDFIKAFNQIPINPANVLETAIRNPQLGMNNLRRLCNASSAFQCFIDEMTRNLPSVYDFVDDLLVHPKMKHRTQNTSVFRFLSFQNIVCL
ncbi:transposon Tf2-9 polyprotein [Nephila pilipes]|uniref:Transposon Tf2-9 polyprotein n=1 Tax=Nephila pilipes TaxID=299642 RepID=A0A8X6NC36_NEPPI|nr:transposon Tf2-9 polyprotein [Nephila pilipes]